ncbi:hypothetical protein ISTM_106 [Insectomime virus]|uniref:F-box domain-containing protein n=1 Tax=Tunisvirus fontaine2 TaxID=1421067 RepID=V9SDG3_9VIRU|nr:hypothetical protein D1R32_gp216 [Tunisvirus fontaine2]AHA46004.1 hypothetical protein ISTM_106 [Insectomime virus]AHC54933.1 hypothetical protein TNS_ORF215 [Tunisvirus fontaine2]
MLEKLPLDNLLQILGYLDLEDLAAVDRTHKAHQFACAQIYLRDEKHQKLSLFLKSAEPTPRWGERWSSLVHIKALRRAGNTNRHWENPFQVPKNERVEKEKCAKRKEAERLLDKTLSERPNEKNRLLYNLWECATARAKDTDSVVLQVYHLLEEWADGRSLIGDTVCCKTADFMMNRRTMKGTRKNSISAISTMTNTRNKNIQIFL